MSGWMLSLVLAGVITLLATIAESNDPKRDKVTFAVKIYVISFLTIYFGWAFLAQECNITHEISTGEPPF
jgi:hypothetical protein